MYSEVTPYTLIVVSTAIRFNITFPIAISREMKDITDTVNDVCMLTVATLPTGLVSHMVGYSLYRTSLLHPHWIACPVQIRAHHHIDDRCLYRHQSYVKA